LNEALWITFDTFGYFLAGCSTVEWWSLARAQHGVITHEQLAGHGLSASRINRMLSDDRLSPYSIGSYLVRGAPDTYRARLWAATLTTRGTLGFDTAARLWNLADIATSERDAKVHIVLPHARRVYPPEWVRLHRVALSPRHVVEHDGLPITSKPWTLCDYLPTLPASQGTQLVDRALQRRWVTADDIAARLRECPHRYGNTRLRAALALTGDGAAAQSERLLHQLLTSADITGWKPNFTVWVDGEPIAEVDIGFPELRIAIEVDGMAFHIGADRFQGDRTRGNSLTLLGWTIIHFTWSDIVDRPRYVIATIRRLLLSMAS
jgi:very-short-patch-repair endonuclease